MMRKLKTEGWVKENLVSTTETERLKTFFKVEKRVAISQIFLS